MFLGYCSLFHSNVWEKDDLLFKHLLSHDFLTKQSNNVNERFVTRKEIYNEIRQYILSDNLLVKSKVVICFDYLLFEFVNASFATRLQKNNGTEMYRWITTNKAWNSALKVVVVLKIICSKIISNSD